MTRPSIGGVRRPEALDRADPRYRYWGSQKPTQRVQNRATEVTIEQNIATMRIYQPIDDWGEFWGLSAEEFAVMLEQVPTTVAEIHLHINSPGGIAFEAVAMLNQLRQHPAKTVAWVDGLAASAASVLAVGCDETVMGRNTELMIHDAALGCYGPPKLHREVADFLDHVSDNVGSVYSDKAGGTLEEWREIMTAETWFNPAEAVAAGLADRIDGASAVADEDSPVNRFDLSLFQHAGRAKAPAPVYPAQRNPSDPRPRPRTGTPSTQEGERLVELTDEQLTSMRKDLGLKDDADAATIVAAVAEVAGESEPPTPTPTAQVPEGMRMVSDTVIADLTAKAESGAAAATKLHAQERATFLDTHRDKFPPSARATWEKQYDLDTAGTREYLAAAAVVVPISELGHGGDGDQAVAVAEQPGYKNWTV